MLPLVCRQTLLPPSHGLLSILPLLSVSGFFWSLLVMKFLACSSLRKCSPAVLEEIFDLSGNNLILGRGLPHFKGLWYTDENTRNCVLCCICWHVYENKRLFYLIRWFLFWTHQVENKIHLSSYQKKQLCTFIGCIMRLWLWVPWSDRAIRAPSSAPGYNDSWSGAKKQLYF